MLGEMLENVRRMRPLIHNITNNVTVNDCANVLLACGASPIMANDLSEVEEIQDISCGLNVNIGTLAFSDIKAIIAAGRRANELGNPVIFDPVGAGASRLRREAVGEILSNIKCSVIKCNGSELRTLAEHKASKGGVDAEVSDGTTEDNIKDAVMLAKSLAAEYKTVVAVTGAIDIVTDGEKTYCAYNGRPMMSSVTGTGCQLSALMAAFIAANKDKKLIAALAAVCAMGVCGEIAFERMTALDGNASYRNYIIDAVYNLDGDTLDKKARFKAI
jgi:hydroxyethylthiazole kinase